jgi:hypothetical protein
MDWLSQLVGIHYNFKGLLSGMGQDILRKWEASCWNPESEYLVANKLQNKCLQIVHFVLFMWQWNLKLTHQIHNYYSNRTTSGICAGRDIFAFLNTYPQTAYSNEACISMQTCRKLVCY